MGVSDTRQSRARRHEARWRHAALPRRRRRALLPRGPEPRPALRRRVLHRGAHDRHLLPAVLPGDDPAPAQRRRSSVSAAAAQVAGYRACRRCLPDATPGSPEWDVRGRRRRPRDAADRRRRGRARRRRRAWPGGSATRRATWAGCSPTRSAPDRSPSPGRAAPRPRGSWSRPPRCRCADIAFAAGFASVRQFNATIARSTPCTPTELRGRAGGRGGTASPAGTLRLRLAGPPAVRRGAAAAASSRPAPCRASRWSPDGTYPRTLALPHGPAVVPLDPAADDGSTATSRLPTCATSAPPSSAAAGCWTSTPTRPPSATCSRPTRCWAAGPGTPGLRVPGHVDGLEVAVRAVVGQQISVAGARTVAGARRRRVRHAAGARRAARPDGLGSTFPDAATLAGARPGHAADAPQPRPGPGRPVRGHRRRRDRRWTAARRAPRSGAGCWSCPASARGRPTTSCCARWATPTCSCRPTSASATALTAHRREHPPRQSPSHEPGGPGAPTR